MDVNLPRTRVGAWARDDTKHKHDRIKREKPDRNISRCRQCGQWQHKNNPCQCSERTRP